MRRWSVAVCFTACATLLPALTACGSNATAQDQLADKLVESAKDDAEVSLDEDCLRGFAAKFSDDDAQQLVDNIDNLSAAAVSPEGEQLMFQMLDCAKLTGLDATSVDAATLDDAAVQELIDDYVANIPDNVSADCFREYMNAADPALLASGQAPELFTGITACLLDG